LLLPLPLPLPCPTRAVGLAPPAQPQYFLVTPKLLTDLKYNNNVNVLFVMCGKHGLRQRDWDLKGFLKKRLALGADGSAKKKARAD
jgi:hypothetical protein